jgi:hypothetical protein
MNEPAIPLRILKSAFKHGISEYEILSALSDTNVTKSSFVMDDDGDGNPQDMFVAFPDNQPYAIEVGICYKIDEDVVFHADKLTKFFAKLYERENGSKGKR